MNEGATAVAIHTDARHYQGQLAELRDLRETLPAKAPIIRHDFIFDPYQVYESRVAGADGIVLLTAVLGENDLRSLIQLSQKLRITPLVDVHTPDDVTHALAAQAPVILINRRHWQTFTVHEEVPTQLRPLIPPDLPVIVTGGISQPADLIPLRRLGVQGVLVSEALARSKDPLILLRALVQYGR
jgi:indole-3-glycerol phosphate synthase